MEKYRDIISFSRDLFVVNAEETFGTEISERDEFLNSMSKLLNAFCYAYCTKFHRLYRNHMMEFSETEEQFLSYTIPRCLKLVHDDDDVYFSFMLVAAFIQQLVFYVQYKRDCYRFRSTAYKCLVAVFKRRFEDKFADKGGWEGLRTYCENMGNTLQETHHKLYANTLSGGDKNSKKHVYDLIKQCDVKPDEHFVLNEYELSLVTIDHALRTEAEVYCSCSNSETTSRLDESQLHVNRELQEDNVPEECTLQVPRESKEYNVPEECALQNHKESEVDNVPEEFTLNGHRVSKEVDIADESTLQIDRELEDDEVVIRSPPQSNLEDGSSSKYWLHNSTSLSESYSDSEPKSYSSEIKTESDSGNESPLHSFRNEERSEEEIDKRLRRIFPKKYGKTLSERMCDWCKKTCYQYGKYFSERHLDSVIKLGKDMEEGKPQ